MSRMVMRLAKERRGDLLVAFGPAQQRPTRPKEAGLVALSANFALYGDLSDRMMSLAAGLGHRQEIYSIDESFVDLTGIRGDLSERSRQVRSRIWQWLGLPTCIGLGPPRPWPSSPTM